MLTSYQNEMLDEWIWVKTLQIIFEPRPIIASAKLKIAGGFRWQPAINEDTDTIPSVCLNNTSNTVSGDELDNSKSVNYCYKTIQQSFSI